MLRCAIDRIALQQHLVFLFIMHLRFVSREEPFLPTAHSMNYSASVVCWRNNENEYSKNSFLGYTRAVDALEIQSGIRLHFKWRPRRSATSAVFAHLPRTMALMRNLKTRMSSDSLFWLIPPPKQNPPRMYQVLRSHRFSH